MKTSLIVFILLLIGLGACYAQKHPQTAYETAIGNFKNCYNQKQVSCIQGLVIEGFASTWNNQRLQELMEKYGKMISYKYIGMEGDNKQEDDALFKVTFDRSVHCMAISLDEHNKIGTFRFKTTSEYIDKLMAKEKNGK